MDQLPALRAWLVTLGLSLGLTLFFELGFALLCGRRGRALRLAALANVLTNPVVVLAVRLWGAPALPMELLAVLAEGLIYQKSRAFARPWLFSLCANALSYGLGRILLLVL